MREETATRNFSVMASLHLTLTSGEKDLSEIKVLKPARELKTFHKMNKLFSAEVHTTFCCNKPQIEAVAHQLEHNKENKIKNLEPVILPDT